MQSPASSESDVAAETISDDERIVAACERISESLLHVKFAKVCNKLFRNRVETVIEHKTPAEKKEWRKRRREDLMGEYETTTGFVIGEDQNRLLILTCAHAVQLCFDELTPISASEVNDLYNISVHCDHDEILHRQNMQGDRVYSPAKVLRINSRRDIILLEVVKGFCHGNHPPLRLAQNLPCRRLSRVGIVSWPSDRHRTTFTGHMSHTGRTCGEITHVNTHGYDFSALEVNMTAEAGSSGAPLIDLESDVVGLLHGGRVECVTYFVSLADLRENLIDWGVIGAGPSAPSGSGSAPPGSGSAPPGSGSAPPGAGPSAPPGSGRGSRSRTKPPSTGPDPGTGSTLRRSTRKRQCT